MSPRKDERLYKIFMAMSHFPGKSLKVTDSADALTEQELDTVERVFYKIAKWCGELDPQEWADLHKLADAINKYIPVPKKEPKVNAQGLDPEAYDELIYGEARRLAQKHKQDTRGMDAELRSMAQAEGFEVNSELESWIKSINECQSSSDYEEDNLGMDEGVYEEIKEFLRIIYDKKIYPPNGRKAAHEKAFKV
jgi:hypothetical protein